MNLRTSPLSIGLALVFAAAGSLGAQSLPNLLPNPDFDTGIDGWAAAGNGEIEWDAATDVDDDPTSGSMIIRQLAGYSVFGSARSECLPLVPGYTVWLEGSFHVASGQSGTPRISLGVRHYQDSECSSLSEIDSVRSTTFDATEDVWQTGSTKHQIPEDAFFGEVSINVGNLNLSSFEARVDGLQFLSTLEFEDGFESGHTLAWSDTVRPPPLASGSKRLFDKDSYDFVTGAVGTFTGGDLYFRSSEGTCAGGAATLADEAGQAAGQYLSLLPGPLHAFFPPESGYVSSRVCLFIGNVYVYQRHDTPGSHVIFRVTDIGGSWVDVDYEVR